MKVKTQSGIEINYEIDGKGPWITLSHSLACNLHMWDEQMDALTGRFKVLRFDTRGHGASSAPAGAYTLEQMVDDVHGLFAALDIHRTHWVGLSMGSVIGQAYALKHPGVFQSLVIAGAVSRRSPDAEKRMGELIRVAQEKGMEALVDSTLAPWFTEPYRQSHPEVIQRIGGYIRSTPVTGFIGSCAAMSRFDLLERLKEIKCPTLIIVGEQDRNAPPDMARAIHQNLPGSDLLIIPSVAHLSSVEQPQIFNTALLDFLDHATK